MASQPDIPASDLSELNPSKQSVLGLNALLFCISDVRNGVGPLLSIYLRSTLGWDAAKIGFALAMVEVSAFISQVPAGLLADASKRKRLLIIAACCLIIIGCLLILSFSAFPLIISAQLLMGVSIAIIGPALGAITLGLFGRKKFPARIGRNEIWNHAGNVSTALAAGLAGYLLGNEWIFYLVIVFAASSIVSVSFIRSQEINYAVARELVSEGIPSHPQTISITPDPIIFLLKRRAIQVFNLSLILYYMANGAQMSLVGQILANQAPKYSALLISGCMIIAEFAMIAVAFLMARLVDRYPRKFFFLIAFLILPIRAVLYTLVEQPFFLLFIQILDGTAAGILGVMGAVINSDLAVGTGRFNFLQGMGAMSVSIGESISLIMAGLIAKSFGFNISFFSLAAIALVGASFFALFMPETKPATK